MIRKTSLVIGLSLLLAGNALAKVKCKKRFPQVAFATQELKAAIQEAGSENLEEVLVVKSDDASPESFQIQAAEPNKITVIDVDAIDDFNEALWLTGQAQKMLRGEIPFAVELPERAGYPYPAKPEN